MAKASHDRKEVFLKTKDNFEFMGETFKIENKELLLDDDWAVDLQRSKMQMECIIGLVGENTFDRGRELCHEKADEKYPDEKDDEKNREYYAELLSNFTNAISDIFPKELLSRGSGWRNRLK